MCWIYPVGIILHQCINMIQESKSNHSFLLSKSSFTLLLSLSQFYFHSFTFAVCDMQYVVRKWRRGPTSGFPSQQIKSFFLASPPQPTLLSPPWPFSALVFKIWINEEPLFAKQQCVIWKGGVKTVCQYQIWLISERLLSSVKYPSVERLRCGNLTLRFNSQGCRSPNPKMLTWCNYGGRVVFVFVLDIAMPTVWYSFRVVAVSQPINLQ